MTGDGRVSRKYLPASMSTEWLRPSPLDDPFLETTGMEGYVRSPYSQSSPHIDLTPHENKQDNTTKETYPTPTIQQLTRTV